MSRLILHWVNEDVQISDVVESPEREFANGYLLGEVLFALKLVDEPTFKQFKDSDDDEDKASAR
jgi:hypothetical protein